MYIYVHEYSKNLFLLILCADVLLESTLPLAPRQPQQRLEAKKVEKPLRKETKPSTLMCVLFSEN